MAQAYPAPAGSGGSGTAERAPTTELFYQLQTLQTEVSELRGLVEEQRHLIERLGREQKEQYLDLDRRVALALKGGGASNATTAAPVLPTMSTSPSVSPVSAPAAAPNPATAANEREAYTNAFNLTRDKRFQDAINGFNQLLVDYPGGEYSANAFYWLGELYLALPQADLEKSRQSFSQVVNAYPSHTKVADSLYKLGVVYHRLGDNRKALEYLTRVQSEFATSPAARLAASYAAEIR
ncbi:MAG: tol-pal system protein YbgF [Gammaproteobacteria bacterium]|nr:tol-pal system protein YbgF [Gammaproteobacteria bacterium]